MTKTNWKNFRLMWGFSMDLAWDCGDVFIGCPWFVIILGWNAFDWNTWIKWSGIRLYYGPQPGWNYNEGEQFFQHEDLALSWNISKEITYPKWRARR